MPKRAASESAGGGSKKKTATTKRTRAAEEVSFKWKGGAFYERNDAPWDGDGDEEEEEEDDSEAVYTDYPDVTSKVSGSILLGAVEVGSLSATLYRRHFGGSMVRRFLTPPLY